MKRYKPAYFDTFRCLAGSCPDSCCHLWDVQIDPDSAEKYRALPGDLGTKLRQALYEEDGETYMALEQGRCPMWREDGLCRLQAELGEDALCSTCREFPRLRHDYGNFVELGLELSCPEAARLILAEESGTVICQQLPGGEIPEYDEEAMSVLLATRKEALALLSPERSVPDCLALLLFYGALAQQALDEGELPDFSPESALETAREFALPADAGDMLDFFKELEILTPQWQQRLEHPTPGSWQREYLALTRYFVNRYWLQAVADYDLYSRVKFAVIACLLLKALGGDLRETAQLFSKEIENDAQNVDAILDAAYENPAFADRALLGLLYL